MRKTTRRIGKWCLAAMALVLMVSAVPTNVLQVSAGSENVVIDNTSFAEELDKTKWNAPGGDILVEGGKLIMGADSTEDTRLITRKAMKNTEIYKDIFNADFSIKLNKLPENQKFIIAFSLNRAESYFEEDGNVELVFENKQGVKVSLRAFDEDGKEQVLAAAQSCGVAVGKTFSVSIAATKEEDIKVAVNNKAIYNGASPVEPDGRIGFLQTGGCAAEIQKVKIVSYNYFRPENMNVEEDFENNAINVNAMTVYTARTTGQFPAGILIEDWNGSKVLRFRNMYYGIFGTKYQYSNFEVSFDVPMVRRKALADENGILLESATSVFALSIASVTDQCVANGFYKSADAIIFNGTKVSSLKNGHLTELADKGYFDPNTTEGFSVKLSVIDTVVTLWIKALDSDKYDMIMQYSLGDATPQGYFQICAHESSNFAIDNFKLVNKDEKANVLDLGYKEPNKIEGKDWVYEPEKVVYRDDATEDAGFNWAMLPVYAGIVAVVTVGTCAIIKAAKKKKKKGEVDVHEID